jgi:acyl dehydratase
MAQGLTMVHSGKKYFEDISVGDHSESGEQHVDKDEMLDFARRYDPQYFHTDPEAAKASVFGEVVASGLFTTVVWRRLDHEISGDIAGDRLRAHWTCVSKRESSSDPRRGVIEMDYRLTNQNGDTVFSCRSVNLIERRG